jgi:hypothetical protein
LRFVTIFILLSLLACVSLRGAESAPLDSNKYPQDTPKKALNSIIKALEKRDFEYWITWLIVPEATKRLVAKHGSLASAALMNADDKHTPRIKQQIEVIHEMLKADKTTEGSENGVKWVRYQDDDKVLQLEQQPDGRWCMNTKIAKTESK